MCPHHWLFFYALLIHSTLCFILVPITGNEVDYKLCIQLLTGSKNLPVAELTSISDNVPKILAYFSSSFFIAYIVGKIAQSLIFKLNPYKSSLLAFDTPGTTNLPVNCLILRTLS